MRPSERDRIDPDGRYPAEGLRMAERQALRVLDLLPGAQVERTRDVLQLTWGGEEGIVAVVTAEALELRLPTVEWTMGAYGPAASSRLWKRHSWEELEDDGLKKLIRAGMKARRRQFATCQHCGKRFPREHRFDARTCHGCAPVQF